MDKQPSNIEVINLSAYTEPVFEEDMSGDYVKCGENNDYFNYIEALSSSSVTNQTAINGLSAAIFGGGLYFEDDDIEQTKIKKLNKILSPKDLRKFVRDYKVLRQAAFQIQYKRGKVVGVFHVPMAQVRSGTRNEKGKIKYWYYSNNWDEVYRTDDAVRFSAFGTTNSKSTELFVLQPYTGGIGYYSKIDYLAALPYAVLEDEISDYLINDVQNGFSGTKLINMNNGVPDERTREQIKAELITQVTGARGQKVLVAFNKNPDTATTIDDIPLDNAPDHYQFLSSECENKIMIGHRITSPLLLGIKSGNSGLGNNADEIKNAYILQESTLIEPYQKEIIDDCLKEIFGLELDTLKFKSITPEEFSTVVPKLEEPVKLQKEGIELLNEFNSTIENYDNYHVIDEIYEDEKEDNLKLMKEIILNFTSTGKAITNAKSNQDTLLENGDRFLTRYRYSTGRRNTKTGTSRKFCKQMLAANKLYRKEDIDRMQHMPVNPGFGPHGARVYDIFKFKGGVNCSHMFLRVILLQKKDETETVQMGRERAKRMGYKPVTNPKEVATPTYYQPNHGGLN